MKSIIIHLSNDIDAIRDKNDSNRTYSFQHVLKEVFPKEKDPIRMNLIRIEELRNHAAHLVIPFIPPDALLLFQATIINYEETAKEWFKRSLCERLPQGMMFLVTDISPEQFESDLHILQKSMPKESLEFIAEWQKSVKDDILSLDDADLRRYVLPINFKLAIVNNPNKADILASIGNNSCKKVVAIKYQRPIDRWPLSYDEIWEMVKEKVPSIKMNVFNAIIKKLGIKGNEKDSGYNFRTKIQEDKYKKSGILPKGLTFIYNQNAISTIIAEYNKDDHV